MERRVQSFARYGGIVAVLIEWLSVAGFYITNPTNFSGQRPLSYFATVPQTRIIFSLCYTLAALSFWIFVKYHLDRYYKTPVRTFTFSMLGFAAVALVPFSFDDPLTSTVHNLFAFSFTVLFIAGMFLMAKHNPDRQLRLISLSAVLLSAIFLALFFSVQKNSQYVMLFEAGSGLICELWMIWISFHSYRKQRSYVTSSSSQT